MNDENAGGGAVPLEPVVRACLWLPEFFAKSGEGNTTLVVCSRGVDFTVATCASRDWAQHIATVLDAAAEKYAREAS